MDLAEDGNVQHHRHRRGDEHRNEPQARVEMHGPFLRVRGYAMLCIWYALG